MAIDSKAKTAQKASASQSATAKKKVAAKKTVGKYINPLTDFGFKHIFGTKKFLIDFLNTVLNIKGGIHDLYYDNTERPGRSEEDRSTIFDLYCTLETGELIMIEMQYHDQEFFKDRTLYYVSRIIQEQGEGKKGDDWRYELKPVYSVNIVNFPLAGKVDKLKRKSRPPGKYVSYIQLIDKDNNEVHQEKLTLVYLELPCFTKELHELTNYIDWWMYVLKNLANMDNLPDALRNQIFEDLFLKAEIAKLSIEERKEYNQSLKKMRDMNIIVADRESKIALLSKENADQARRMADQDRMITDQARRMADKDRRIIDQARQIAELERKVRNNPPDMHNLN